MEVTVTVVTDWWDKAGFFLSGFTLAGILALTLVWRQLKSMEKARYYQALLHFLERWDSEPMEEARQAVNDYDEDSLTKAVDFADENNSRSFFLLTRVADFFEDLGYASSRERKYVQLDDVVREFGGPIVKYHKLYGPYINLAKTRERKGEQEIGVEPVYTNFSQLWSEMERRKAKVKNANMQGKSLTSSWGVFLL